MKRILTGIWIVLLISFLGLTVNYISNEVMISNYNDGNYTKNQLSFLGFTEPYIAPYNQGNIFYQNKDFDNAIEQYQKALSLNPPYDRECMIRINIALCMVTPIEPDKITPEELDEVLKTLETAKSMLLYHGCAHEQDSLGHNEDAQKLKEDIDELENLLKNHNNSNGGSTNTSDPDINEPSSKNDDLKEKLQEFQNQGMIERARELEYWKQFDNLDIYYGITW